MFRMCSTPTQSLIPFVRFRQWFSIFFASWRTRKNLEISQHTNGKQQSCFEYENLNATDAPVSENNEFETKFRHHQIPPRFVIDFKKSLVLFLVLKFY